MIEASHVDHPVYIDSNEQLAQLCDQWQKADVLALDTEFIRTDTFFPIAGLIQLSDGKGCFLIDPLTITDFTPFSNLLIDSNIIKVLHSCSEDMEVFDRLLGVLPQPVYDTQIGAALAGYGFSLGYQKLVDAVLQQHVPKGETRSDWLKRPLSDSQIHYASLDVAYLHELYEHLNDRLTLLERTEWWQEECSVLLNKYNSDEGLDEYYKKVKSAWKLSAVQLEGLRNLTTWREQQARKLDRPRNRVLKDRACFDIAQRQPKNHHELAAIDDVSPGMVRKLGDTILAQLSKAATTDQADYPPRLPKPLPPSTGSVLKALKNLVRQRAEHLNLPAELLVKKRDYEYLLRSGQRGRDYRLPPSLDGWRKAVIGEALVAFLEGS